MKKERRKFSASFKAKVAIEAIREANEILQELSHLALKSLTDEQEIIENKSEKQPKFDQLLGALMKVRSPTKESK